MKLKINKVIAKIKSYFSECLDATSNNIIIHYQAGPVFGKLYSIHWLPNGNVELKLTNSYGSVKGIPTNYGSVNVITHVLTPEIKYIIY